MNEEPEGECERILNCSFFPELLTVIAREQEVHTSQEYPATDILVSCWITNNCGVIEVLSGTGKMQIYM